MFFMIQVGLLGLVIFMVMGLYSKIDTLTRQVQALRKALAAKDEPPAAAEAAPVAENAPAP